MTDAFSRETKTTKRYVQLYSRQKRKGGLCSERCENLGLADYNTLRINEKPGVRAAGIQSTLYRRAWLIGLPAHCFLTMPGCNPISEKSPFPPLIRYSVTIFVAGPPKISCNEKSRRDYPRAIYKIILIPFRTHPDGPQASMDRAWSIAFISTYPSNPGSSENFRYYQFGEDFLLLIVLSVRKSFNTVNKNK